MRGDVYRHLFRARRLTLDDEVRLVDGGGRARLSRVVEIESDLARLKTLGPTLTNEAERHVELLVAIPKSRRLSWMVEKTTEVGIAAIRLLRCERGPRSLGDSSLDRLRRVAVAAVEQSNRSLLPEISGPHSWDELDLLLAGVDQSWVLQPGGSSMRSEPFASRLAVLVGPEGGWSPDELIELEKAGCNDLGLGPTLLRIETAAVVGCARILQSGQ